MSHDEGNEALREDGNMKEDSQHCGHLFITNVLPTTTMMDMIHMMDEL